MLNYIELNSPQSGNYHPDGSLTDFVKLDPEALSAIGAAVEGCLTDFGYVFTEAKNGDYRFKIATDSGRYRSQILVSPEAVVRYFVFLTDDQCPSDRRNQIREIAERLNGVIVFGSFAFQFDSGAVIYRDAEHLFQEPVPDDIARVLNRSAIPIRLFRTAFETIATGASMDPEAAVLFSVLLHGCADDEKAMNYWARRKLLSLVDGAEPNESKEILRDLGLI